MGANTPVVRDVASGRSRVLPGAGMAVRKLAAHPTAALLYTSTADGRILEWPADAEPLPAHHLASGTCSKVSASPSGGRYAAVLDNGARRLVLVELASGELLATRDESIGDIAEIAHAPGGALVCATADGVLLLDRDDLRTLTELAVSAPSCLAFSPDGETLFVGTRAGRLLSFDVADWSLAQERATPLTELRDLAVHPDGGRVALVGIGETGAFDLDLESGDFRARAASLGCEPLSVTFSPVGAWLAIGGSRRIQARSCADGAVLMQEEKKRATSVRFTADSRRLLCANSGTLRIYDTRRWSLVVSFKENTRGIQDMDLAADGTLLTCDYAGDVCVWRAAPLPD